MYISDFYRKGESGSGNSLMLLILKMLMMIIPQVTMDMMGSVEKLKKIMIHMQMKTIVKMKMMMMKKMKKKNGVLVTILTISKTWKKKRRD